MNARFWKGLAAAALALAVPLATFMVAQSQKAASADEDDGPIVEIAPGRETADTDDADAENEVQPQEVEQPKYWIGLQGGPIMSQVLRTQLQLADDVGVVVENIVPDSPAEKAGLRQHDIIVAVNGEPISDLAALQEVVAAGDAKAIDLKVIRLAKEQTVTVKPEERPADLPQAALVPGSQAQVLEDRLGDLDEVLKHLQQHGGQGGGIFGRGMILGGQGFDINQAPSGVSVSITREGDGPAKITVKKGDDSWTVEGDDQEALKELPEDVRPFVEQMIGASRPNRAGGGHFNFGDLQQILPDQLGDLEARAAAGAEGLGRRASAARERTEQASRRLMERMEQMEQRLKELQQQLEQQNPPAERTVPEDDASKN